MEIPNIAKRVPKIVFSKARIYLALYALVFLGICLLSGCAVLFKGQTDKLVLDSNPTGAEVFTMGRNLGTTPLEVELHPKKTGHLEFRKEGFQTTKYNTPSHIGALWVILDILGGIYPCAVDAATDSWLEFDEVYIKVNMDSIEIVEEPSTN